MLILTPLLSPALYWSKEGLGQINAVSGFSGAFTAWRVGEKETLHWAVLVSLRGWRETWWLWRQGTEDSQGQSDLGLHIVRWWMDLELQRERDRNNLRDLRELNQSVVTENSWFVLYLMCFVFFELTQSTKDSNSLVSWGSLDLLWWTMDFFFL